MPEDERAGIARRRRSLRWLLAVSLVILTLVLVWGVVCWRVVSFPKIDTATTADAIVLLGPAVEGNISIGRQLVAQGISNQVIISVPDGLAPECSSGIPGAQVSCIKPDPVNTRGEAQLIGRLAQEHGWRKLVVVTWREHIARSRMLIERCFAGNVQMVAYGTRTAFPDEFTDWIHQTGGWIKASVVQRSC